MPLTPEQVYKGNPPVSVHQPSKTDIVQFLNNIEASIAAGEATDADIKALTEALDDRLGLLETTVTAGYQYTSGGPVAAATTGNITLSGEQTIDGVSTSASRVLVKNQTSPGENGIYVTSASTWARASDMDATTEVQGTAVYVSGGTVNKAKSFITYSDPATLGTDPVEWVEGADLSGPQGLADAAMENSRRARRWISGNAITTRQSGIGVKIRAGRGYYYKENNGGAVAGKIAPVAETTLAAGYGLVVDLDGTPDGNGDLVPQYVAVASGAQTGWEAGERRVLIARDVMGQLFGEYHINAHVGAFDGEAAFVLNSGDDLPHWDDATRTLTWPDLLLLRHRGDALAAARIKLAAGSIVVPSGGYQTVVLDMSQVTNDTTPNTAVSVGQYIDATPGWDGAEGDWLPLFAVGYGLAYPIRFPPVRGTQGFVERDPQEIVVTANGTDTVDIFMKGSAPLSDKYLQYPMVNIADASIGADVWRWQRAFETERTGDVDFTQGMEICTFGENEMAIMIAGKSDFIGGNAHGDEKKVWARMLIDGSEVSLLSAADYRCRRVEFMQESELFEPDTTPAQSNRVAKSYKRWKFEAGYVDIWNHIVWEGVYTLDKVFLAMLCLLRANGATQISDKGYREPLWAEENISASGFTQVFDTASIAKASGPSGYSAEVEILDGWDKSGRRFNFSNSASYNKLYFDFTGPGYVTSNGEVFTSHARYKLDTKN